MKNRIDKNLRHIQDMNLQQGVRKDVLFDSGRRFFLRTGVNNS